MKALIAALALAQAEIQPTNETHCIPYHQMMTIIQTHGYEFLGDGEHAKNFKFQIYKNPEHKWIILRSQPDGITCLMAMGTNWEHVIRP